jgi:hypothetical protein
MASLPFRSIAQRPTDVNAAKQENPSKATTISDTAGLFCHRNGMPYKNPQTESHSKA